MTEGQVVFGSLLVVVSLAFSFSKSARIPKRFLFRLLLLLLPFLQVGCKCKNQGFLAFVEVNFCAFLSVNDLDCAFSTFQNLGKLDYHSPEFFVRGKIPSPVLLP